MSLRETALNAITFGGYGRTMEQLREAQAVNAEQVDRLIYAVQESGQRMIDRMKEDLTWQKLSEDARRNSSLLREEKIEWARTAFETEAFAKRGVSLKTEFVFAGGIDGPRGKQKQKQGEPVQPGVQALLDFWNDEGNQATMFAAPMQVMRSNQLLTDGDLFLLLFVGADGVKVRRYGSTTVKKIIHDPDDATRPLYYACKVQDYRFDAQSGGLKATNSEGRWQYYRDFRNTEPATDPLFGEVTPCDFDVYMMHVPINCIRDGEFGESEIITSLKWLAENNKLVADQCTISRVTAALMNTLTAKTKNENALAGLQRSLKSTTEAGGPKPPLPGAMNVMSDGLELNVNRTTSQASDAWQNTRMIRMAAAQGMGFPLHYLGDPENASLATSKSMELPALKPLEAYQTLWRSIYTSLFTFVLRQRGFDPAEVAYDIPMPKLVEPELAEVAAAIMDALEAGLITKTQAAQRMMELLGFDDIPERLEELLQDEAAEGAGDADALAQKLAAVDQAQGDDDDNPPA